MSKKGEQKQHVGSRIYTPTSPRSTISSIGSDNDEYERSTSEIKKIRDRMQENKRRQRIQELKEGLEERSLAREVEMKKAKKREEDAIAHAIEMRARATRIKEEVDEQLRLMRMKGSEEVEAVEMGSKPSSVRSRKSNNSGKSNKSNKSSTSSKRGKKGGKSKKRKR
jgi:hypothetical protein